MLYFRDKPPDDLFITSKYVTRKVIPFPRAWTHLRFAAELWRDRPDVTFIPAHTLPISFPGRAVVTVHDLGFKVYPEAHPVKQRLYLDWTTRYSAARATLILADSQATAHDLRCYYGTPQAKIRVVYPAINPPRSGVLGATRRKYNLPEDYFLFVGTLQPRKNIARIVEAFARWKAAHPDSTVGLVLAGQKGWLYDEAWLNGVENVYLPGYIDEADKAPLYMGAIALVFPSLYEGFGFPVLEAMHCGTPVIASNTSSLPELVGQGGLLVNPLDVNEIMVAMDLLTRNKELHWAIRSKGYMQAAQFTWHTAAQQTMAVLEEAAG
jgi:glycosyltransferase involved in cell wall biosynthesis